jgi:hypothetical protein
VGSGRNESSVTFKVLMVELRAKVLLVAVARPGDDMKLRYCTTGCAIVNLERLFSPW